MDNLPPGLELDDLHHPPRLRTRVVSGARRYFMGLIPILLGAVIGIGGSSAVIVWAINESEPALFLVAAFVLLWGLGAAGFGFYWFAGRYEFHISDDHYVLTTRVGPFSRQKRYPCDAYSGVQVHHVAGAGGKDGPTVIQLVRVQPEENARSSEKNKRDAFITTAPANTDADAYLNAIRAFIAEHS